MWHHPERFSHLTGCVSYAKDVNPDGLFLEFGTAGGQTATHIAKILGNDSKLYTFDWFHGLVDQWHGEWNEGAFSQNGKIPALPHNCEVVNEKVESSKIKYIEQHLKGQKVAFVHLDFDTCLSTKHVLHAIFDNLIIGNGKNAPCIFVFDEFHSYESGRKGTGEYKAWHMEGVGEYAALIDFLDEYSPADKVLATAPF
jgi:Na+-translocating ferredoxin:NAD+ oxidoreductase RNF subunit RnfB